MPNRTRQLIFHNMDPRKTPNIMDLGLFPPFSGALEWLKSHKEEIRTLVKLLYTYPYLIQDESMDEFWNFLQSLNNAKDYHDSLDHEMEWDDLDPPPSPPVSTRLPSAKPFPQTLFVAGRTIYLCFPADEAEGLGFLTKMDAITQAIMPFCFVRSNISFYCPHTETGPETLQSISDANVFIFYLCEASVKSKSVLDLLCHAVANNIPVIMVREPGYKLPVMFCENIRNVEITRRGHHPRSMSDMHFSDVLSINGDSDQLVPPRSRPPSGAPPVVTLTVPREQSPADSLSSLPTIRTYFAPSRDPSVEKISLTDVITDGFKQSVTYIEEFHDRCIDKLYNKLSEHLGNLFPEPGTIRAACRVKRSEYDHHTFLRGLLKDSKELHYDNKRPTTTTNTSNTGKHHVIKRTRSGGNETSKKPSLGKNKSHGSWEGQKLPPIPNKVASNSYAVQTEKKALSGRTSQLVRQANVNSDNSLPLGRKSMEITERLNGNEHKTDKEQCREKSTSYLLFPETSKGFPRKDPELVRWPLTQERAPEFIPFSDSPITFDDCSFDIDWALVKSETPSPDLT